MAIDEDGEEGIAEEFGARKTRKMQEPTLPDQAEQDEHAMTHVPFRSWCRHCIRGRAEEIGHFGRSEGPSGVEVHLDYCFPGDENGQKLTILVVVEKFTKM